LLLSLLILRLLGVIDTSCLGYNPSTSECRQFVRALDTTTPKWPYRHGGGRQTQRLGHLMASYQSVGELRCLRILLVMFTSRYSYQLRLHRASRARHVFGQETTLPS